MYEPDTGTVDRLTSWALSASPAIVQEGREWYTNAHKVAIDLSATLDVPIRQAAGILAALSPGVDAGDNFAESIAEVALGHRDRTTARQMLKVRAMLAGVDPDVALPRRTSPKTHSFYRNIMGDDRYVTIDGRIADMIADELRPWAANRGIDTGAPGGRYDRYSTVIQDVTHQLQGVTAPGVQAVLWLLGKSWELSGVTLRGTPRRQGPKPRSGLTYTQLRDARHGIGS